MNNSGISHNLTYEELKPKNKYMEILANISHNLTYEELKLLNKQHRFLKGLCHNLTYEELKHGKTVRAVNSSAVIILPMRN